MVLKRAEVTQPIIREAIEVHRALGPGHPEAAYREALGSALTETGIECQSEMALPVEYNGVRLDCGYRLDLVVQNEVVIELKSVENLLPIHSAQLITYLRLGRWGLGLLFNFNVCLLKDGIRRMVCDGLDRDRPETALGSSDAPALEQIGQDLTGRIIAAGINVHRELGPGLLASAYEMCLKHELTHIGLSARSRVPVPLTFRGRALQTETVLDLLVEERLPVQIQAVDQLLPIHEAGFSALLGHGGWPTGLILNFNVPRLVDGIRCCHAHPKP